METTEQKRRRLYGKQFLHEYLKELNALTNIQIEKDMLLSIEETDKLGKVSHEMSYKSQIFFHEKDKLLIFIGQLIKLKNGMCYLWISYSNDCGILKLNSLNDFNVNFNFEDEHAGLIAIIMEDLSNELILDYFEDNGEYYLDIETYGKEWSNAKIE